MSKIPESFVLRVVIRESSLSETKLIGNQNSFPSENFSVKNHSIISRSESIYSSIDFRHSTIKTPS